MEQTYEEFDVCGKVYRRSLVDQRWTRGRDGLGWVDEEAEGFLDEIVRLRALLPETREVC